MIVAWDEIGGEVMDMTGYSDAIEDQIGREGPADEQRLGWEMQYVVDFPGGQRVIVETDERAHTCIWLVTYDD